MQAIQISSGQQCDIWLKLRKERISTLPELSAEVKEGQAKPKDLTCCTSNVTETFHFHSHLNAPSTLIRLGLTWAALQEGKEVLSSTHLYSFVLYQHRLIRDKVLCSSSHSTSFGQKVGELVPPHTINSTHQPGPGMYPVNLDFGESLRKQVWGLSHECCTLNPHDPWSAIRIAAGSVRVCVRGVH